MQLILSDYVYKLNLLITCERRNAFVFSEKKNRKKKTRQLRKKTKKQRRALFGKIRRAKGLTIKIRPGKRGAGSPAVYDCGYYTTGFLKKEAFIFTILPPGPSPTRPEQSSRSPGAFGQENFLLLFYAWRRSCTTTTVAAPSRLVTLLL